MLETLGQDVISQVLAPFFTAVWLVLGVYLVLYCAVFSWAMNRKIDDEYSGRHTPTLSSLASFSEASGGRDNPTLSTLGSATEACDGRKASTLSGLSSSYVGCGSGCALTMRTGVMSLHGENCGGPNCVCRRISRFNDGIGVTRSRAPGQGQGRGRFAGSSKAANKSGAGSASLARRTKWQTRTKAASDASWAFIGMLLRYVLEVKDDQVAIALRNLFQSM